MNKLGENASSNRKKKFEYIHFSMFKFRFIVLVINFFVVGGIISKNDQGIML